MMENNKKPQTEKPGVLKFLLTPLLLSCSASGSKESIDESERS